ncbi:MAG: MYXO-CTERM sorting domain-containing protein [Myxococcales bacterium]|nr:MYXO-CTERM sorting domain-containing protein [Myxococcales bacterium]
MASVVAGDASAAIGGPDALGWYSFVDQDDGAVYNYVDITATGTIVATGANATGSVPLPFPFLVYGHTVDDIVVNSNGFLGTDIGSNFDASNDCPLPASPSTGEGFRIYALHDTLTTDVYYQYLDSVEAAAAGFAGTTDGVSVFQWVGIHTGGGPVDFEVVLFHDDYSILTMIAADAEAGSGSTIGIQEDNFSAGLTYQCNTPMGDVPGTTAVLYTLAPDSSCCDASASGAGGCLNIACQGSVCDMDPSCCDTEWTAACAALADTACAIHCGAPPPPITINEIRIDQTLADNDEYIELIGPPGTSLDGLQYIVIGDVPTGEIEEVTDLSGNVIPPSGYFLIAEGTFTIGPPPDLVTSLAFDNLDTVTHMLVAGYSGAEFENVDGNADGVFDFTPWDAVLDTVAVVNPADVELPYGPNNPLGGSPACAAGPRCQEVTDAVNMIAPYQVFRCPNGAGAWQVGNQDVLGLPSTDTPGSANLPCACGDGMIDMGEDCDDVGESATCDIDCTLPMCGDGVVNLAAGEICDDMGESASCDADCTEAVCGDGIVNMAAAEPCDGDGAGTGGESATCNADCTPAVCGDGIVNMSAGEECDDMGETATCDADCTMAMCGDMVVNTTAGETCDDGGRSEMCNDDCTAVSCGDGVVNTTAGEECDDGGESETCDDDCTNAMCGDMLVNATAGEECDDGGESATCDDDCTPAECGDGVVNTTAGEECDDGNTSEGDGCDATCLNEGAVDESGSGGMTSGSVDESGTGMGPGDDSTGGDTEGDTAGAASDDGCNCSTDGGRSGAAWSVLALFGLGALRRRRRRA